MVWEAISKKGKSQLVFDVVDLNAQAYTEILANYLLAFIERDHGEENDRAIFPQDKDPAHSALRTNDCFFDNIVYVLDWLAKSSDMNVIKNAWTWSARDVYQGHRQFDYVDDFKEALIDERDRMSQDYINNLINSIPP